MFCLASFTSSYLIDSEKYTQNGLTPIYSEWKRKASIIWIINYYSIIIWTIENSSPSNQSYVIATPLCFQALGWDCYPIVV